MLMLADADVVAADNDVVAVVVGKAFDVVVAAGVVVLSVFFYTGSNRRSRGID